MPSERYSIKKQSPWLPKQCRHAIAESTAVRHECVTKRTGRSVVYLT